MELGQDPVVIGAILGGLLVGGYFYDQIIIYAEKQGYLEPYMAIFVVAGVMLTLLLALPLIGWQAFVMISAAFACSGLFMVIGSMRRYAARKRRRDAAEQVRRALDDE